MRREAPIRDYFCHDETYSARLVYAFFRSPGADAAN